MVSFLRFGVLVVLSLAWLVPAWQAWQLLDRMHGLELTPDALTLRRTFEAVQWTVVLMGGALGVWWLQWTADRRARRESVDIFSALQDGLNESQRRLEADMERLGESVQRHRQDLQSDMDKLGAAATRLRATQESRRLEAIDVGVQRLLAAQQEALPRLDSVSVDDRLAAMERTIEAALRELGGDVVHKLRGLEADLYERDQRVMTDFGTLDHRLSDDADRWEARLRGLEHQFAELMRKTTLDGAQVSANLKLLSLRVKELAAATHG